MKKIINLTPHEVVVDTLVAVSVFPPSGQVARVKVEQRALPDLTLDGHSVPVVANTYGEVEGLPDPQDGVGYVVSSLVLQALEAQGIYRGDVFAPDTGPTAIRGSNGQIRAVTRLVGVRPR